MKLKNIIVALVIFLYSNAVAYAQGTNIVTLNVNTEIINDDNVLDVCSFTWEDPDGDIVTSGTGPELENWLITISLDSDIEWKGMSSSGDNKIVDIIQIKRQSGTRIFDGKTLNGDSNRDGEKVRGKPEAITNEAEGDYKYNIKFRVKGVSGTFDIDPKIRVVK